MSSSSSSSSKSDIDSYLGTIFPFLLVLCFFIVYHYAERGHGFPWHTSITCVICYFISLGIILLVPIDIATVIVDRQSTLSGSDPTYNANSAEISKAYSSFFVMVIVFAQVVMVFQEYYNCEGHFTILSRLWNAFLIMLRDLVLAAIVGAIILGILVHYKVMPSDGAALQLTAVIVTNTIYEFFLMFLLGYGLIEFPRRWWLDANLDGMLLRTQIKAASDFADIRNDQSNMSIEYANAQKTNDKLQSTPGVTKALQDAMSTILQELPTEGFSATRSGEVAYDKKLKPPQITIRSLAALRTRINYCRTQYRMSLSKVEKTKLLAYHLEDLMDAKKRNTPGEPGFDGVQRVNWSLTARTSTNFEYQWHLNYRPWLLRFMAGLWALLSIFSFIGVVGSFNGVNVESTPYFKAVHNSGASTGSIVIFVFVTFGYTVYITFWSLFQMRLGGLMELVPGETTPLSLSFNARMIARLAAPLVFFYLGWLAENGCTTQNPEWTYNQAPAGSDPIEMTSSFADFYQLQQVAFIRRSFGTIFPSILIVFIVMVVTDFYNWLCVKCGASWAQFGIPRVTAEQEREGKRRLVDDKKKTLNAARRKRMLSFLMHSTRGAGGQGGEADDRDGSDGGSGGGGGGLLSYLWGPSKSLALSEHNEELAVEGGGRKPAMAGVTAVRDITPPAALGGMVEVKGAGRVFSSWKEWWAEVQAPGVVCFSPSRDSSPSHTDTTSASASASGAPPALELTDVIDFKLDAATPTLLRLLTTDNETTLRFKSSMEADSWRRLLIEWKDFSVDNGVEYMRRKSQQGGSRAGASSSSSSFPSGGRGAFASDVEGGGGGARGTKAAAFPVSSRGVAVTVMGGSGSGSLNAGAAGDDDKPRPLDCFVEMKKPGSTSTGSGGWERRFLRVDERSNCLIITKSSGPSEKPLYTVSLPEVVDIVASRDSGPCQFEIQMDDVEYKFRAGTDAEGQRLAELLNAWKDWLLLNLTG